MNISQLDNLKSRSCWTETCLETIHIEHCDRCSLRACWRLLIIMCHVRSDNITWIEVHHGILFDRRLDHDRTLSNGTIGYSVFEVINGKSNALVHQIVQVQGVFAKSYHHANLQNKKRPRLIVQPSTKKKCYNDQHSRITCGQILGGSGDSWLFWGDENEPKLGSTIDSCQGFVAGLWCHISATL